MSILKKLIKIALIIFLTTIVTLVVVAWSAEDQITRLAINRVSQTLNAPMGFEGVSFSLIRDFPLATVTFKGIWIGSPGNAHKEEHHFETDTIAKLDRLYISVESIPLLDNIFNIMAVEAKGGNVNFKLNESGHSNFSFLLNEDTTAIDEKPDSTVTHIFVDLKRLQLTDLTCQFLDEKHNAKASIYLPDVDCSAKIDSTIIINAQGNLELSECAFDFTTLNRMEYAKLNFDISYQPDTVTFSSIDIRTDGAALTASGRLSIVDAKVVALSLTGSEFDLATLSKFIPEKYLTSANLSQIAGKLDFQAIVDGVVTDSILPLIDVKYSLSGGKVQWQDYPLVKNLNIRGNASNGPKHTLATTDITVDDLTFDAGGNNIHLSGNFFDFKQLKYELDSRLDVNLQSIQPYVPDTLIQNLSGKLNAQIKTKGVLPDSINKDFIEYLLNTSIVNLNFSNVGFDMDTTLSIKQLTGKLKHQENSNVFEIDTFNVYFPEHQLNLTNHQLSGSIDGQLTNPKSLEVTLKDYHLSTGNSFISGNASVRNLDYPDYNINSDLRLDLAEAKNHIPDSLISSLNGLISANLYSEGKLKLDSIPDQIKKLAIEQSTFDIILENVSLSMPDTLLNVQHVSGRLNLDDQLVTMQNLNGVYQGIDFRIDTSIVKNLFHTVIRDRPGKLEVRGVYRLGDLDYDMIGLFTGTDTTNTDSTSKDYNITNPEKDSKTGWNRDYEFKGKLYANSLKYGKALIEDISTLFNVRDSVYKLDQLKFNAFDGTMNSAVKVDIEPDGTTEIHLRNQAEQMNIKKLLYEMDNFNQSEIKHENISGQLSSDTIYTKVVLIGDSVLYPEMRMTGDFTISQGGIYNYALLQQMAPSIPGVKRLDTLVLKTLKTELFILEDVFYVPQTIVVSNALDISVVGKQGFGEDFKYYLGIRVGEVLLKKSKKRQKKQEATDEITLDENNFKLIEAIGKSGKYKIRPLKIGVKTDRDIMKAEVSSKAALINLRFNPKLVNFNTGVEENDFK